MFILIKRSWKDSKLHWLLCIGRGSTTDGQRWSNFDGRTRSNDRIAATPGCFKIGYQISNWGIKKLDRVCPYINTLSIAKILSKMHGHGSQWFSHKMNNRHPLQLKKSISWEPFWSYQLNSNADFANLAQFWGKWAGLAVLWAGGSKTASGIFIFQLSWVLNIYLMWNPLRTMPEHFWHLIFYL